jgi:crossover junction endodeoxyribonuclease RusA
MEQVVTQPSSAPPVDPEPISLRFTSDIAPPSGNTYYRKFHNHMVLSQKGRDFKARMLAKCKGLDKVRGPIALNIRFRFKDARRRDIDNYFKALLDAFKDVLFEDDSMVQEISAVKQISCKSGDGFDMVISKINTPSDLTL